MQLIANIPSGHSALFEFLPQNFFLFFFSYSFACSFLNLETLFCLSAMGRYNVTQYSLKCFLLIVTFLCFADRAS
jgi:hypothetical protein